MMAETLKKCRICTEVAKPAISLLGTEYQQFNGEIAQLLNLVIDPLNGFPTIICEKCLKTTNDWLALKYKCAVSQEYFSSMIENTEISVNNPEHSLNIKIEMSENSNDSIHISEDVESAKISDEMCSENSNLLYSENIECLDNSMDIYTENDICSTSKTVSAEYEILDYKITLNQVEESCYEGVAETLKPKKKELRVLLERIDVDKYLSELSKKKTVENEIDPYIRQFVIDPKDIKTEPITLVISEINTIQSLILELKKGKLCEICNQRFVHLNKHLSSHTELNSSQIHFMLEKADLLNRTCPICNLVVQSSSNVKVHLLGHSDFTYQCDDCSENFNCLSSLQCHIKKTHQTMYQTSWVCSYCNKSFAIKSLLRKHITLNHISLNSKEFERIATSKMNHSSTSNASDWTKNREQIPDILKKGKLCEICNDRYYFLRSHLRLHHTNLTNSQIDVMFHKSVLLSCTCPICNTVVKTQELMPDHLLSHSNEPYFNCKYCSMRYMDIYTLNDHMMLQHPTFEKYHPCCFCSKLFDSTELLIKHVNQHKREVALKILNKHQETIKSEQSVDFLDQEIKSEITIEEMDWNTIEPDQDEMTPQSILRHALQFGVKPTTMFQSSSFQQ